MAVGLGPAGGSDLGVAGGPAGKHALDGVREGVGPIADDRAAGLEMELGAIGGATDAEGLIARGRALGEVDGPRRCYCVAPEALAQLKQLVAAL